MLLKLVLVPPSLKFKMLNFNLSLLGQFVERQACSWNSSTNRSTGNRLHICHIWINLISLIIGIFQARNEQLLEQNNSLLKQLSELLYKLSDLEEKCSKFSNDVPWSQPNSTIIASKDVTDFNFLGEFMGENSVSRGYDAPDNKCRHCLGCSFTTQLGSLMTQLIIFLFRCWAVQHILKTRTLIYILRMRQM